MSLLSNFIVYVKNQFNLHIKVVIIDNGKEFDYDELYNIYSIMHQRSWVETPQNFVVGHKNQTS